MKNLSLLRLNCNKTRLYFLSWIIPADGRFERSLSLALDRALVALEGGDV
jgi:hypothetical protein